MAIKVISKFIYHAILLSLFTIILLGCSSPSVEEFARKTSPDGKVDAIVMRVNAGAMGSYAYPVCIVPAGTVTTEQERDKARRNALFLAAKADNLRIKWIADKRLEIGFSEADIFKYSNFWHSKEVDNHSYRVRLQLAQGDAL